jgi:DNA repair protein RadC
MEAERCRRGQLPVVRLALAREKCARNPGGSLSTPEAVLEYVRRHYGCKPQEYFLALGLDSKLRPLGILEVGVGGFASSLVDPKVLFSGLLLMGAQAFILYHNHPSGDPEPSVEDVTMTRQLMQAAQVLSLRFLDHIVAGVEGYVSFSTRGLMNG